MRRWPCAGSASAYNAGHACESGGPLRVPPNHRLRNGAPHRAPIAPRPARGEHGVSPLEECGDLDGNGAIAPVTDEPVPLPGGRSRPAAAGPPSCAPVRGPARSPLVTGPGARPAQRTRHIGRRCRLSIHRLPTRGRDRPSATPVALGAAEGHAELRRDHRGDCTPRDARRDRAGGGHRGADQRHPLRLHPWLDAIPQDGALLPHAAGRRRYRAA